MVVRSRPSRPRGGVRATRRENQRSPRCGGGGDRAGVRLARRAARPVGARDRSRDPRRRRIARGSGDARAGRRGVVGGAGAAAAQPRLGPRVSRVRRRARGRLRACRRISPLAAALHVALDVDEAEELRRHHELQRSLGLAAEWLRPAECRELEPGLAPGIAGGVHAADDAEVDPRTLVGALVAAIGGAGGEIIPGAEATDAVIEGERLRGVRIRGRARAARRSGRARRRVAGRGARDGSRTTRCLRCDRSRARS